MTPEQFIAIWKDNKLTERGGAQAHFDDLCDLLGVDKPRDPENYCFERGAKKAAGGDGWADVWKRGCFGWENKKPGRDLDLALKQLTDYALQLENPPLLVVSDRERIIIHTAFTGYPDEPREIRIEALTDPENLQLLRWVFTDPIKLRPEKSTAAITEEAAGQFAALAKAMRGRGLDGQQVAHFLVQCLFCMFAEDENLLPTNIFTDLLKNAGSDVAKAGRRIQKLFSAMQNNGGEYGDHDIAWFNGGLFKTVDVPELSGNDLTALYDAAANMDWRAIDPTIFGTLFERGLDPSARAPLGAHYTDTATIIKLIKPLITEPLLAEWQAVKELIAAGYDKKPGSKGYKDTRAAYSGFLARLNCFQVLDPACGSGNFLYLALKALRDVEKLVHIEAHEFGFEPELLMQTGPHNIRGIEINEYAAELARVTVWIGDIQWCRRNGREIARNPILRALDGIEHRDALIVQKIYPTPLPTSPLKGEELILPPLQGEGRGGDGVDCEEAPWPAADVIIGNPPFLGQRFMLRELGEMYATTLRKCYEGRVSGAADLVTYWLEKARAQIEAGKTNVAGFVTTNSIRGGANQLVLARICDTTRIFTAWSDEEWINEGAAVRVSIICFGNAENTVLDGNAVSVIHADLTAGLGLDLTQAQRLPENSGVAFSGFQMNGSFDVSTETALEWLNLPNPNGKSNSDVLHPYANAKDITSRSRNQWVIDFTGISEKDAALYEKPFEWITNYVKPERDEKREEYLRLKWWLHKRSSPELRKAIKGLKRFIATPMVSKYRLFVWLPEVQLPENAAIVFASNDDTTFGILHSRFHELWSLKMCTWMGKGNDPRYTPTTCFETFPFPVGANCIRPPLTVGENGTNGGVTDKGACHAPLQNPHFEAIASAAVTLNQLRENWLNPPEWVDWVITPQEEKAGFPKRPVAKPGHEADLKKRTLTNLYNARPSWLDNAHKALDKAVAAAYGWPDDLTDDEILSRLLALNLERAGTEKR